MNDAPPSCLVETKVIEESWSGVEDTEKALTWDAEAVPHPGGLERLDYNFTAGSRGHLVRAPHESAKATSSRLSRCSPAV